MEATASSGSQNSPVVPRNPTREEVDLFIEFIELLQRTSSPFARLFDVDDLTYDQLLDLGEHNGGAVETGLSPDFIARHLKKAYNPKNYAEDDNICVMCQEEYDETELLVGKLDCGHKFHEGCIKSWLQKKNQCPICRQEGLRITTVPPWLSAFQAM